MCNHSNQLAKVKEACHVTVLHLCEYAEAGVKVKLYTFACVKLMVYRKTRDDCGKSSGKQMNESRIVNSDHTTFIWIYFIFFFFTLRLLSSIGS